MKNIDITSRVAEICKEKELDRAEFIRLCLIHKVCGVDAAKRVFSGNVNVRLKTAAKVSGLVLGVQFTDAFIISRV